MFDVDDDEDATVEAVLINERILRRLPAPEVIRVLEHSVFPIAIDCLTPKPRVNWSTRLEEALDLMQSSGAQALPVFKRTHIAGAVTYSSVAEHLIYSRERAGTPVVGTAHRARALAHDFNNILTILFTQAEGLRDVENLAELDGVASQLEHGLGMARDLVKSMSRKRGAASLEWTETEATLRATVSFFLRGSNVTSCVVMPARVPPVRIGAGVWGPGSEPRRRRSGRVERYRRLLLGHAPHGRERLTERSPGRMRSSDSSAPQG